MGRLNDKVAVITGAGSGMGRAAAILFAKEGAKVAVIDWKAEAGEETVKMIKEAGGEAIFIKVDVSKTEDVKSMVKTTVDTYGKLDILYNNAGIGGEWTPIVECTEENFDKTIAINLKGVWLGMKYAIPEMIKTGGGSIINTASVASARAQPGSSHYTASKGGVEALSRLVAIEYVSQNIRVNAIIPGVIATPMAMGILSDPEARKRALAGTPRGRFGEPEEIAWVALFLASDEASLVTGHTLVADGGTLADSHLM